MNETQVLLKTKAITPQTLLEKVDQVMKDQKNSDPSQWPLLRIQLRDGANYSGYLAEMKQDRSVSCLAFVVIDNQGRSTGETVFFETTAVLSVSVLNAKQFAKWLSGGEIARSLNDGPAPSRLALKRMAAEISDKMQKKLGNGFTINLEQLSSLNDDNAHLNAQDLLKELGNALDSATADDIGMSALRPFTSLEFAPSSDASILFTKSGSQIQLHFHFAKALPDQWQIQMKDSLNSIL